jgi:3-carboxy-cis,cis-muconate cycloisomerase
MPLLDPLFRWPAVDALLDDRARVQAMLDFEAALARVQARAGVIPAPAAEAIAAKCRCALYDLDDLARATAAAGNPALPLVERLAALVAGDDPGASTYVHWGATSQDAIDTGLVLQIRRALDAVQGELRRLADGLASLSDRHRADVMAGRTLLQHAVPITFGLKAAGWLDAVTRHRARLREVRARALALQLGGAAGSLSVLGDAGPRVAEALAGELGLDLPAVAWHAHRDRTAEVASWIGLCTGTLGKIARDLVLLAQTEVDEVREPAGEGRGGSSTMPQKRNPVAATVAVAAAARVPGLVATLLSAMVQENERAAGGWHAEWETLPELASVFAGALHHLTDAVVGLDVDGGRMRANLDRSGGLVFAEAVRMALAPRVGRAEAARRTAAACARARAEGRPLREVLATDPDVAPHLPAAELASLFDLRAAVAPASALVDRVLAAHAGLNAEEA